MSLKEGDLLGIGVVVEARYIEQYNDEICVFQLRKRAGIVEDAKIIDDSYSENDTPFSSMSTSSTRKRALIVEKEAFTKMQKMEIANAPADTLTPPESPVESPKRDVNIMNAGAKGGKHILQCSPLSPPMPNVSTRQEPPRHRLAPRVSNNIVPPSSPPAHENTDLIKKFIRDITSSWDPNWSQARSKFGHTESDYNL